MAKQKLSKQSVDAAKPQASRYTIWDTEIRGFGIRVSPSGAKSYWLKYVSPVDGGQVWHRIAAHPDFTPGQARKKAEKLRGDIADGVCPAAARKADKQAKTVSQLCDQYLAEGCATKKPSTIATDKGRIERHIKPLLGQKHVKDVTSNDVRRFMKAVADGKTAIDEKTGPRGRARVVGGKGTATRTVGLLGGVFSFAVAEGIRQDNPVRGVKRFPDQKGKRYLTPDELRRLGAVLSQAEADGESPQAITALRLLILTGCRKSEILALRWDEVDFDSSCLRLSDSKTGEKSVPIGAAALEVLAMAQRVSGNPYVIFGSLEGRHLVGLPKMWNRIRAKAGLGDVRLHDLRHSFASVGAGAGMGLQIVGALLGHRDPKTTAQYAHIADSPAKVAADSISETIASTMRGESAEVVDLTKRGA